MNVVECTELKKKYFRAVAVNNMSFTLEGNKITGLIGPNGAGKTTLLKVIAGFLQRTSGEVRVFSENPFNNLKVSLNTIFIEDNMTFPQSLFLEDILNSAASFYENWDMKIAKGLFTHFSLHPKQSHNNLSKGMKSTFNMIIGIASRCALTILDEPTTGMDAGVRKDFYRALLKDYIQHPRCIILSSHLLNEIDDVLEDVLLIREGEKLLHMPISDLKDYALGLRGKENILADFTENKKIYHKKNLGKDSSYIVVRNDFTESIMQKAKTSGVDISPVTADDICVYLTSKNKGGIDDVFDRN